MGRATVDHTSRNILTAYPVHVAIKMSLKWPSYRVSAKGSGGGCWRGVKPPQIIAVEKYELHVTDVSRLSIYRDGSSNSTTRQTKTGD